MQDPIVLDRRAFVARFSGMLAMTAMGREYVSAADPARPFEHPEPRPGITAERVLTEDAIGSKGKNVLAAYDAARDHPAIFDGLACGCGCTGKDAPHRSLLVCFETSQPTGCHACQAEAELVDRMAKDGAALAEIRTAVDK